MVVILIRTLNTKTPENKSNLAIRVLFKPQKKWLVSIRKNLNKIRINYSNIVYIPSFQGCRGIKESKLDDVYDKRMRFEQLTETQSINFTCHDADQRLSSVL